MTLQDSESVGQSQLRAVGPLGYSRPRGKASHWFPRSGPCCSLIGRELPRLLENVAGSQTSDVYKNLNPQHPRQAGEGREDRTGYQSWSSIKGVFTQNFKRKFYGWSTDIQSIANLQNGKNTGRWWGMLWTSERRASGHLHIKTYKTNHREKSNPDTVTELFTKKSITN